MTWDGIQLVLSVIAKRVVQGSVYLFFGVASYLPLRIVPLINSYIAEFELMSSIGQTSMYISHQEVRS